MEYQLPEYKVKFIEYLLNEKSLKFGDFTLKSKRSSPYFFNAGELNDGVAISKLGEAFANSIISSQDVPDLLFGPSYKGISLAVSTSIALAERGNNIGFTFDRKEVKTHGEGTGADLQKTILVGSEIKDNQKIVIVEDVFTTGQTKYETLSLLNKMAKGLKINYVLIVFDRQELGIDGKNAVEEFIEKTGIPVRSVVSISDTLVYLKSKKNIYEKEVFRIENYIRVYGNAEAKAKLNLTPQKIVDADRSIIPACDVETLEQLDDLVKNTHEIEKIGGYKIGFELGLGYGLTETVKVIRKYTNKPVIYDHQKAGTDIPETGKNFAQVCKKGGVDCVIFFPQAGPETARAWIYHALNEGLSVMVGGRMTHIAYATSEGGFITDEGALEIYRIAAYAGINNFVVPGNKLDVIEEVKKIIENEKVEPIFYSPGFIAQGGKLAETAKVAGDKFHPIVGRGIYLAKDKTASAIQICSLLP